MKELITIGNETFSIIRETENGYEFRDFASEKIHDVCNHGELNATIYRMIDRLCQAVV